jgi:hypothetical protein
MHRHLSCRNILVILLALLTLPLLGCEEETREKLEENSQKLVVEGKKKLETAKEKGKAGYEIAKEKTEEGLEIAKEKGKAGFEIAKEKTAEGIEVVKEKTREGIEAITPEEKEEEEEEEEESSLGSETLEALKEHAKTAKDHVVHWVTRGKQITHATVEVGKVVVRAVELSLDIDCIYQDAGDEQAQAELDQAITSMATLEVMDGVTVGLERIKSLEKLKYKTGAGYLVLWRRGDKLIGFVWRSEREIDLGIVISEAPRLMGLIHAAIDGTE